ncbi:MAG: Nif3-like dinuclear metal center hexameric protein [Provencibacterium sp.]|jgi:dinuclear metal center YbgI/SA1388 family protein|nr:Nif3-like dinuclear metal center hexameric protein [Provencibacterium sp.]
MKVKELFEIIDRQVAPFSLAEEWDNSGLLVGDPEAEARTVLVCLDITLPAVAEAVSCGAQLILSHHPVIFHPLKRVTAGSPVYALIQAGISAICAHTNLDLAPGGVNDCLARVLGLRNIRPLGSSSNKTSLGRRGELPEPLDAAGFAALVSRVLTPAGGVRYIDGGRPIREVAVCGGAGGSLCYELEPGIDALLTSELKHNVFLDCTAMGLTAVDAGHHDTECVVLPWLCERLAGLAPEVNFIQSKTGSPVKMGAL